MKPKKLTRVEAEYAVWQYAYSYISAAANSTDEDFHQDLMSSQLIDPEKLPVGEEYFFPTQKDKELLMQVSDQIASKILKKMIACRNKYNKNTK